MVEEGGPNHCVKGIAKDGLAKRIAIGLLAHDGSPLAHVRMTVSGALDTNWQVQSLSLADDVSGALAVEGSACQVRLCDSSTDLFR